VSLEAFVENCWWLLEERYSIENIMMARDQDLRLWKMKGVFVSCRLYTVQPMPFDHGGGGGGGGGGVRVDSDSAGRAAQKIIFSRRVLYRPCDTSQPLPMMLLFPAENPIDSHQVPVTNILVHLVNEDIYQPPPVPGQHEYNII
jgi:hypothetical protein